MAIGKSRRLVGDPAVPKSTLIVVLVGSVPAVSRAQQSCPAERASVSHWHVTEVDEQRRAIWQSDLETGSEVDAQVADYP